MQTTKHPYLNENGTIKSTAPFGVFDRITKQYILRTTYKHRKRARRLADKKDLEYGAYRYHADFIDA
tara:strand:+ start:27 stop:227 length:201 start_codon:yes stop_codon:yes gene_type:complete